MSKLLNTVDTLISQVRSQIDEDNIESVDDVTDILPALNRAQDYGCNVLARHYEDPMLVHATLDLTGSATEYDIPEDAFEDRLEKVEIQVSGSFLELKRLSYRDSTYYESQTPASVPTYYVVIGRKIRLLPKPSGTYDARIWYLRAPDQLTEQQGRITRDPNVGGNYIIVDQVGENLSDDMDSLESYVNVVDGQTGQVKATLQIDNISSDRITFRSAGVESSVLNREISTSLAGLGIDRNDYICNVVGTCVPQLARPMGNFIVQYAVAEMMRKMGGPADMELRVLEKFEKQVERSWVGREQSNRVKRRSNKWGLPYRNWYFPRGGS